MIAQPDPDNKSASSQVLTDQTNALLRHLWRGGAYGYYWFASQGGKYTQWMDASAIAEPLERWKTANTYFAMNPTNQRGTDSQRSSIATIAAVNCLYAEFDVKDYGSKDAIITHLEALPKFPGALVDSGGGYHGYWLLDTPCVLADDATRQHAQRVQRAWVEFVGGDPGAADLTRVLRLPGTQNLKPQYAPDYPRVGFVEFHLNRTNKRAELESLCARLLEPKPIVSTPVTHRNGNGNHRPDAYAQTALDGELDTLARTPEGGRNNQLNTSAFNVGLLISEGLLDAGTAEQQLTDVAAAIGLPEHEARATVRSGLAAGMRGERRAMPDFNNSKQQRPRGEAHTAPVTQATPEPEQAEQPARRFQFLSPAELLNLPPRQWLVYPLVGVGDMAMIFGESGAGKTFVTVDLLLSCALGQRFADQFEVDEAIRVAYCAGEGGGGIAARFQAAIASREAAPGLLERNLTVCLDVPNLFEPGGGLHQFADDYLASGRERLDLLVIDTLHSATAGANENSTQDASKILASLRFLQKTLGCAVLLVHHANRAGTGERGSSAFRAAMDVIVEVVGNGELHGMRCSKLKDGQAFAPLAFSLVTKGNSVRVFWHGPATAIAPQGEEREAQSDALQFFRDSPNVKFKCSTIAEATGRSRQAAQQLCTKLHKRGEIQREVDQDGKTLLYWFDGGASGLAPRGASGGASGLDGGASGLASRGASGGASGLD